MGKADGGKGDWLPAVREGRRWREGGLGGGEVSFTVKGKRREGGREDICHCEGGRGGQEEGERMSVTEKGRKRDR